ncbi:hypothetical protein ACN28E_10165 [Archangium lansingense]|uniref:hypothetical protein n=1 Tax=Archangium lansingense TaxID=2995310 RepID=UPI003B789BD2
MVLALAGHTVELRSETPFATPRDSVRIQLQVLDEAGRPLRDASVSLTVNVGSVTEPTATQEGALAATYRPPAQEGPQVALFHAVVRSGAAAGSVGWLALPVHGQHQLRVPAPPRARVSVSIGSASFGPVTAGARGSAVVSVEVPPGVTSAEVTLTERSGRRRTLQVPLPAARFARVRIVSPPESPGGEHPVRLQGFVVDESGSPVLSLPPLAVSVDRGRLGPIEPREGATFEVPYTAPERTGEPVTLSAAPLEEPERSASLKLEPRPGPLARLGLTLSSPSFTAGSDEPITVEVVGYDAKGNLLPAPPATFFTELGTLEAESGGRRARLRPPDAFGARKALALRVQAGALQGEVALPLQSGPPVRGEAIVQPASQTGGGDAEVIGRFVDAWGNPVDGLRVKGSSPGGNLQGPEALGEGRYRFRFTRAPGQPAGPSTFELQPEGFPVLATGTVSVRAPREPWQPTVGLLLFAQSNAALSKGLGVRLEGSLRIADLPVEALLQVEGRQNARETQQISPVGGTEVQQSFTLRGASARLGARWSQPFLGPGVVFADATVGLLVMTGDLELTGGGGTLALPIRSQGLAASVGGGLGWPLGAGRVVGQIQFAYAPGSDQVRGNLGGLSVGVGYQLPLFGGAGR